MNVVLAQRSAKLLDGAKWKGRDQYPAWQCFADELERLLAFAEAYGQFSRFAARLQADIRERNSALAELRVAAELADRGFHFIDWEPLGAGTKRGEFLVSVPEGASTFVEVKAPDWHGEITGFRDVSRDPVRKEIVEARKREPKYRNGSGGAYDPSSGIQFAIEKAYPKFTPDQSNLLIIPSDDLFISYQYEPNMIADMRLFGRDGLFTDARYQRLGGLGMFWYEHRDGCVVSDMETFANPHALSATALPSSVLQRLHQRLPEIDRRGLSVGWVADQQLLKR